MNKSISFGLLLLSTTMLTACEHSSSSGSSDTQAPRNVTLTPQATKTLKFTWDDVANETEYRLLENPDGMSGFTKVATLEANAKSYEHTVFLPARINAQYILQACNTRGCKDSTTVSVSGSLTQAIGYLKASNTESDDNFGSAISLSADGNTLAVSAPREASNATGINSDQNDNSASKSGAVYLFTRSNNRWSQQAYLKASNTEAADNFGNAVSLSADGNTLAVSASYEGSSASDINGDQSNNSASGSGAVYLFVRSNNSWSQQAYLKASNAESDDYFGSAVSLSEDGNTLAVGAYAEDSNASGINDDQTDNSASNSGAVYLFTRSNKTWSQQAYLKASNTESSDYFGSAISLSGDGNTLAVGAFQEASNATGINNDQSDNSAFKSGAVYLFSRSNNSWSQQAYLKASNTETGDLFGFSISLSADGSTLAVGAFQEASNATGVNGDQSNNSASGSGAVYLFTRSNDSWSQQAYLKSSNTESSDLFGYAVSLSADSNTLAVGAYTEDSNATGINGEQSDNTASGSGAVYLFARSSNTWSQQAYLKASNTGPDYFGRAVSLSADGNTLAIGAYIEDSNTTGINGDQTDNSAFKSGAVYLY